MPQKKRSHLQQEADLFRHLKKQPPVDVIGVVDYGGVGGRRSRGQKDWTLLISLKPWKRAGEKIQRKELTVRKRVGEQAISHMRRKYAPSDLLRLRVHVADETSFGTPQAMLIRVVGKASDPELEHLVKERDKPVTVTDRTFGTITYNRELEQWQVKAVWNGNRTLLHLQGSESAGPASALKHAKTLWRTQVTWQRRLVDYAIAHLLDVEWLQEDQVDRFARKTKPTDIDLSSRGRFSFWYAAAGMLGDHAVVVEGTIGRGPTSAEISG